MYYFPKSLWPRKWHLYLKACYIPWRFTCAEAPTVWHINLPWPNSSKTFEAEWIACPLTNIINSIIKLCDFPDKWKQARITPIPKVISSQDNNDFRPISIFPVLSKICERLIHNQVVEFLENHNLLEDNISGFRKGHSTHVFLLRIRDGILILKA